MGLLTSDFGGARFPDDARLFAFRLTDSKAFMKSLAESASAAACPANRLQYDAVEACTWRNDVIPPDLESARQCADAWLRFRHWVAKDLVKREDRDTAGVAVLESLLVPAVLGDRDPDHSAIADAAQRMANIPDCALSRVSRVIAARYALLARRLQKDASGMERARKLLLDLSPADPLVGELELDEIRRSGDLARLKTAAVGYKEKHRTRTTGDYYLAWADYLAGEVKKSLWHLQVILALNPTEVRATHAFEALSAPRGPAGEDSPFLDLADVYPGLYLVRHD
jgi:hypothetical protein